MIRLRLLVLSLLAVLLGAGSAEARTTIIAPPDGRYPYQRWVDQARVPTPDMTLLVVYADHCPGRQETLYPACTAPWDRVIWMDPEMPTQRQTLLHEVGHNVDYWLLPDWMRARFMTILGLKGTWNVATEPQPLTPAEIFAEVWKECAAKPIVTRADMRRLGTGPIFQAMPTGGRVRHNRICRMLQRL